VAISSDSTAQPKHLSIDRREFIATATTVSGDIATGITLDESSAAKEDQSALQSISSLLTMDGLALSKAIKTKQVSCREVMATFLDQYRAHEPEGERNRLAATS
jgi:hypothetical protein